MRRGDLADLTAFVAVADLLSFRAASERLGVTASALSHTIKQLEERLGVRLLQRYHAQRVPDRCGQPAARAAPASDGADRGSIAGPGRQAAPALRATAGLRNVDRGSHGRRAGLDPLPDDLPRSPAGAGGRIRAARHRGKGIRCRHRAGRACGSRHDRCACDGSDEVGGGRARRRTSRSGLRRAHRRTWRTTAAFRRATERTAVSSSGSSNAAGRPGGSRSMVR